MTNEPILQCIIVVWAWFVRYRLYPERTKTFVFGFVFVCVLAHEQPIRVIGTSQSVTPYKFCKVFKYVVNPLVDDVSGFRFCDGAVKKQEELSKRGLVHHIDFTQLDNEEIQN